MSKDDEIEESDADGFSDEPDEMEEDLDGEFDDSELDEDDLGDEDLDPDLDEDLGDDDDDLGDDDLVDEELDGDSDEGQTIVPSASAASGEEEEFEDDELDPDDVEASLDDILKDRLVIEDAEVDDDDSPDLDDRGEGASLVIPKRPDEFVCQSCFLVKHPSQIADTAKQYCKDCV